MPNDNARLAGLLGLGKGGGGHHHGGGRFRGGGGWGGGWGWGPWWPEPLYVEAIPGVVAQPSAEDAIKVYKQALLMKEAAEKGVEGPKEVYNGTENGPKIVPEGHLPKASPGWRWVFSAGESKTHPGVRGRWILYIKS
jgi:hypothetical protein